jgi:hypothetical protein
MLMYCFRQWTMQPNYCAAVRNVVVPHGIPCHVIVYDFVPQLLSLLQNPDIMIQANLSIDVLKPLDKFDSPCDGQLGNVHSGSVNQQAYATYITNPERELFVPIIQWIDRTHITGNARFLLKPYMFTPAIFTEPFCRTIQAWGYHGFLPKTNLTKISASKRLGLVFLFVILAQYDEGWAILNTALLASTTTDLKQVPTVFEAMLCFDQWLNQPTYWTKRNHRIAIESIQTSIRRLMKMCKDAIPTDNPSKWKFPKFHELLHIVDDMTRFGATTNFCAQRPESLLIPVAKQPGRRA